MWHSPAAPSPVPFGLLWIQALRVAEAEALLRGGGSTKIIDKEAREIIGTREALTLACLGHRSPGGVEWPQGDGTWA